MSEPTLAPHAYVLAVQDLEGSSSYFTDVLGFLHEWDDAENWHGLMRGNVRVMLGKCSDIVRARDLGDHSYFAFIATDAVDDLHREFEQNGAQILAPPADKTWGWREMAVATPEGHRMMFAEWIGDRRD